MEELTTREGTVQSVVFQNEENGYTVLRLVTEEGELITVVGCIPCAAPGKAIAASPAVPSFISRRRSISAQSWCIVFPPVSPGLCPAFMTIMCSPAHAEREQQQHESDDREQAEE